MSYTPSIPESGETLGGTRSRINQNFSAINTVMAINHVAFNDADEGKHAFLQMPEQSSAPSTSSNEAGVYAKQSNSVTTLFYRSESNGQEYQLTSVDDANIATFGSSSHGWTFLPGGLILQYGVVSAPGLSGTITFDRAFSAAPYSISISNQSTSDLTMFISNFVPPNATSFSYQSQGGVSYLYWMAIGPE